VLREIEASRATGAPFRTEYRILARDGRVVWFRDEATVVQEADGRPVLHGVAFDITHLKEAQRAAAESERRYRLLADNISDVIAVSDMNLKMTYVSPSVLPMRGFTPEEAMAQSTEERMTPASGEAAFRALAQGLELEAAGNVDPWRFYTVELELYRKDGSTIWTEARTRFLRDGAGRLSGFIVSSRDITERRQLEQLKSDFIALATHQLRTPLNGIRWQLELVADDPGLSEDTRAQVEGVRQSAERLAAVVNDLLDTSQLTSGTLALRPVPTELGALTGQVVDELGPAARERGVAVSVAEAENPATTLMVDRDWLRQAVMNLVSNAIKYTPAGGRITIRIRRLPECVQWEIEDTGIGIPRDAQPRLFQRFYQAPNAGLASTEGNGLGLYLARLVVERLGGRIWCESEEGQGSRFAFTLPAPPAGA
jgi:PAS domain S-box-containing protein